MLKCEPLSTTQKRASILYIHVCGSFGGSSRSLLEMIKAFPSESIQAQVVTPEGNVAELFRKEEIPVIECAGVSKFDNTEYGYYRGRRWLILLRELFYVLPTLIALLRAKARWAEIDLIHVNEITGLPAIVFAKLIFRKPLVLHVRSVQQTNKAQSRSRMIRAIVRRFCDSVVAIDDTVQESLPKGIESRIIHNGFFANPGREPQLHPALRDRKDGEFRFAMVGQLLPLKGVYEFIEAARLCKVRGISAKFILVGEGPRDLSGVVGSLFRKFGFAREVRGDVEGLIEQHGLHESVLLIGFTPHIRAVYENIDVICFPSHLNAVGRPVFEAAFFGVPSIVAVTNRQSDTFIHRETGLAIEARNPIALADAIEYFCRYPEEMKRMGEAARKLAVEQFSIAKTAKTMLELYETQIGEVKNLGRLEHVIRPQ